MSEEKITPEWHRLPHDAVGFFGLAAGFERRDLKRRYNEFIRQFKPEKFPQEFQRIRAAYEELDLSLRYGNFASQQAARDQEYQWRTDLQSPPARAARQASSSPKPVAVSLHERIRSESISGLYAELVAKPHKTAFEFYALAVMSDATDRQDGMQFANWLLKGLAAHPKDMGLLRLLHEYVRGPLPAGAAPKLLVACSKTIGEEMFFPVTEPLWQALLRADKFAEFRATLAQCEANFKGLNITNRIIFTIQILKSAMWQADEAWINQTMAFIETNFDQLPHYLEYDVEIIAALRAYMAHRKSFVAGHPLRQQMDQALRDYFTEDQTVGDRSILECQIQLTQDTDELRGAFVPLKDPSYGPFYNLWSWIAFDVAERHLETKPSPDESELWFNRTRTLLAQMKRQTHSSRLGMLWYLAVTGWYCLQGVCYLSLVFFAGIVVVPVLIFLPNSHKSSQQKDGIIALISVAAIVSGVFVVRWLIKRYLAPRLWHPINRRLAARCYREQWQPEVLNFLARSHVPYHVFTQYLAHAMTYDKSTSQWIQHHVNKDYSLAVYSVAQRFII